MKLLLILAALLVAGCTVPRSIREGGVLAGRSVSPNGTVLILAVKDGQEQGQSPAIGSGNGMVSALRQALRQHGVPFSLSEDMDLQAGLAQARQEGDQYVLKCDITLWQDNATAWSANGDKLTISVELYDAGTGALVATASHRRVATGFTFVSGSPDRFMDEVATGALGKIYGWPVK